MASLSVRFTLFLGGMLAAGIVAAALIVFLGVVSYLAISQLTSTSFAALIVGLAGLAIVVFLAISANVIARQGAGFGARSPASTEEALMELATSLGGQAASVVKLRPVEASLASLVLGFTLGAVPELRDSLIRLTRLTLKS